MTPRRFVFAALAALLLLSLNARTLLAYGTAAPGAAEERQAAAIKAIEEEGGHFSDEADPKSGEKTVVADLSHSRITDAGLDRLSDIKNLSVLDLSDTQVTDAGIAKVAGLKNLTILGLMQTKITDAGLKHVAQLPNITKLFLVNTKVTDAGLKELARLKNLSWLDLGGTRISATGLGHLAGLRKLSRLYLDAESGKGPILAG